MRPSTTNDPAVTALADSDKRGHAEGSVAPGSSVTLDNLAKGAFDRGSFDGFNQNGHTLEGSYSMFASGTGCEYEASDESRRSPGSRPG